MQGECAWPGCPKDRWHGPLKLCVMHLRRYERGRPMDAPEQRRGLSVRERFYQHVDVRGRGECWPWTGFEYKGYGRFGIDRGGERWSYETAHCIAWELEHGREIEGWGLHTCDFGLCCNPEHVYEGDGLLNTQDAIARGRLHRGPLPNRDTARGTRNGLAKLTEDAVREIRRRYAAGRAGTGPRVSQQALADEYGVNQSKISLVVRRRTWAHVA